MERSRGAYSFLRLPSIYSTFQWLAGSPKAQRWLLHELWGLKDFKGRVVDIGCGTGSTYELLADCAYIGFDINGDYIASATERFGDRATFLHGDVHQVGGSLESQCADVVICLGVLHHLDDAEANDVARFARRILRPGGRFLGLEATYLIKQDRVSRMILNRDRGRNIRYPYEWDALLHREFDQVHSHVTTGLLRIPYTHYIYEAIKPEET